MNPEETNRNAYLLFSTFFIVVAVVILKTFLFGLLWGAVMAVSVWPLYENVTSNSGLLGKMHKGLSATLIAGLFALVFLGPMAYGIYELANAYSVGSSYLSQNSVLGVVAPPSFIQHLPFGDKAAKFWVDNIGSSSGLVDVLNRISNGKLLDFVPLLWGHVMDKALTSVVMLVSFYFMLKHGRAVKSRYKAVLVHWVGERSVRYIDSAIVSLRGTINGVVLVGAVEGMLLAVPLVMGGVTAGLLIGLAAGLLGVIPLLMPLLVLPCLGYLYLEGQTTWAVIGAIDLALVWFIFENVVKPQVIGHKVRINTYLILMSMVGGVQLVGLVGLFLGPAFVAVALGMLRDLALVEDDFPIDK